MSCKEIIMMKRIIGALTLLAVLLLAASALAAESIIHMLEGKPVADLTLDVELIERATV